MLGRKEAPWLKEVNSRLKFRNPGIMVESDCAVSAVFLPLIEIEREPHVLFETRSENLKVQPGEICFPGGQVEREEMGDPSVAAVREVVEELGIQRNQVELIGPLDILPTPYGQMIYPYVGRLLSDKLVPNPQEVAGVFTVPLAFLQSTPPKCFMTDVATRLPDEFPLDRVPRAYSEGWHKRWEVSVYYYEYDHHFIWGMTAKILHHFIELCWPAINRS